MKQTKGDFVYPQYYFTADTHFDHGNIIKYCSRIKFMNRQELQLMQEINLGKRNPKDLVLSNESIQCMNDYIIKQINEKVGENDILYHLGDFFWENSKLSKTRNIERCEELINRINCKNIYMIWGNHDPKYISDLFSGVFDIKEIKVEEKYIVMCHYPMRTWNRSHYGAINLYGHVHQSLAVEDAKSGVLALDVGVDGPLDYAPWSFEEIKVIMDAKMPLWNQRQANERSLRKPSENK